MDQMNEQELIRVRLRFIDLIKSFFVEEPDAEKMSRWRGTFSALSVEQVNPRFDAAVMEISKALSMKKLQELQDEFYDLFGNPIDGEPVEMTASYYLDGRSYSQSLVDIRSLMDDAGLKKEQHVSEPEDSLVVMLDTYGSLVEAEKDGDEEQAKKLQARLLEEFLEPFTEKFSAVLKENKRSDFYNLCCRILAGYLDLEKSLVVAS